MRASIVIRAHNAAVTIARAIASALSQDVDPDAYEIIVVDDGSTDGTRDILARYRDEPRVRPLLRSHSGAISAANSGLAEARGTFVSFLDADDTLEPAFVRELSAALLADTGAAAAYCDYREERDGTCERISPRSLFEGLLGDVMFRRAALIAESGFREYLFADYELFLRTFGRWRTVHVKKLLFTYTRHAGSLTADRASVAAALEALKHAHPDKLAAIDSIRRYD